MKSQKVRVFRQKTAKAISQILMRLSEEIRKTIISKYYPDGGVKLDDVILRQSSDNNREGADLYHICGTKRIVIEVKFGDETSRNIGMKVFESIFGTDVFTSATCLSVRKSWERLFVNEGRNEQFQFERLWTAINGAIDAFNSLNEKRGFVLPRANQEYMEKEILNTTGSGGEQEEFIKFVLDGETFDDFKKIPTGIGRWTIDRVHHVNGRSVSRCNVFVRNYDTNVEIKYVLNWKNNHPLLGNVRDKVSAKLGLGTPSWNVWVEAEATVGENMEARELDQFYTRDDVAVMCVSNLVKILPKLSIDGRGNKWFFVEPSAGDGAFLRALKSVSGASNRQWFACDIDPHGKTIEKKDFLKDDISTFLPSNGRVVVLGNPPFGKKGKLASAFINKGLEYASTVGFVLPIQFNKFSGHNQIVQNAKLIFNEPLPTDCFVFRGKPYSVRCCLVNCK